MLNLAAVPWDEVGAVAAVIAVLLTVISGAWAIFKWFVTNRRFRIVAESDKNLRTKVRFTLRGQTPRAIQDVHLAMRRSILHMVTGGWKNRRYRIVQIDAQKEADHSPPVNVADSTERVFTFGPRPSWLPRGKFRSGWETRMPRPREVRVYIRTDAKGVVLKKPRRVDAVFED